MCTKRVDVARRWLLFENERVLETCRRAGARVCVVAMSGGRHAVKDMGWLCRFGALSSEAESRARRRWLIAISTLMVVGAVVREDDGDRKVQRLEGRMGAGFGDTAERRTAIMVVGSFGNGRVGGSCHNLPKLCRW